MLDPVPAEWLHLSLTAFGATDDVTEDCVRQAINAAHEHISVLGSLELSFSQTVVFAESVVLRPDDSPGLRVLRAALLESVRQVRGAGAPGEQATSFRTCRSRTPVARPPVPTSSEHWSQRTCRPWRLCIPPSRSLRSIATAGSTAGVR